MLVEGGILERDGGAGLLGERPVAEATSARGRRSPAPATQPSRPRTRDPRGGISAAEGLPGGVVVQRAACGLRSSRPRKHRALQHDRPASMGRHLQRQIARAVRASCPAEPPTPLVAQHVARQSAAHSASTRQRPAAAARGDDSRASADATSPQTVSRANASHVAQPEPVGDGWPQDERVGVRARRKARIASSNRGRRAAIRRASYAAPAELAHRVGVNIFVSRRTGTCTARRGCPGETSERHIVLRHRALATDGGDAGFQAELAHRLRLESGPVPPSDGSSRAREHCRSPRTSGREQRPAGGVGSSVGAHRPRANRPALITSPVADLRRNGIPEDQGPRACDRRPSRIACIPCATAGKDGYLAT